MDFRYVQFGCGPCAPSSWLNFDSSPTLRLQKIPIIGRYLKNGKHEAFSSNIRYGDIVKGLSVPEGRTTGLYCSHVLEHLALHDFRLAIKNSYSYLEDGGTFRFVLPDLERLAKDYLGSNDSAAALEFMRASYLGRQHRAKRLKGFVYEWLGNSSHLWMWDYKSIAVELINAGFRDIRRAQFGDSNDEHFKDVEQIHRWEDCLGVQCRK